MKTIFVTLAACTTGAFAADTYVNFIRQTQQTSGVVWDMPVAVNGSASSALALENGGSLFQLWTVKQSPLKDYLLDQKVVGAYMPTADVTITTPDPYTIRPRTRVDKGYNVNVTIGGLVSGSNIPDAAAKVLLEQHIQNYSGGTYSLNASSVLSNTPTYTAYISANGLTTLKYVVSSLKATDPTKASGEEHFVVHALADGALSQTQLDSTSVQVWPVASGSIVGLTAGANYKFQLPPVTISLIDLYPRSDTYFMLYEGSSASGTGTIVKAYPMDRDTIQSLSLSAPEIDSKIGKDGTYTVALMSQTVYGTELLCPPITFSVTRTISVNAMQVNFSDSQP